MRRKDRQGVPRARAALLLAACWRRAGEGEGARCRPRTRKGGGDAAGLRSRAHGGNPEAAEAAADQLRERFPTARRRGSWTRRSRPCARSGVGARTASPARLWDYQANAVGKGTQRSASIFSRTVDLGEDQPAAMPDAQLVLRDHPEWGRSAYLLLAASKFSCGKPCTLQLAFDGGGLETWQGKQADSGKGPALFIEDEARFFAALQKRNRCAWYCPRAVAASARWCSRSAVSRRSATPVPERAVPVKSAHSLPG
jgi:hypothetical protein